MSTLRSPSPDRFKALRGVAVCLRSPLRSTSPARVFRRRAAPSRSRVTLLVAQPRGAFACSYTPRQRGSSIDDVIGGTVAAGRVAGGVGRVL